MERFFAAYRFWLIIISGFVLMNGWAWFLIHQRQHTNDALIKVDQFKSYDEVNLVILGNSRPACDVVPSVLDSMLKRAGFSFRSYNLAIPGVTSSDIGLLYKNFVRSRNPKVLLLQTDPEWLELDYEKDAEQRVHRLFLQPWDLIWMFQNSTVTLEEGLGYAMASVLPLVRYRAEVREWVDNFDFSFWDKSAYESELEEIADGGYRALDGTPKEFKEPDEVAEFRLTDPLKVVLRTARAARKDGIKVFVIDYPHYDYLTSNAYHQQIENFFEREGCVYLDYLSAPVFRDKRLFFDKGHLNQKGAELLSKQLAQDLARALKHF
ncbi:MAG: hypothetical protein K1X66_00470 [Verrucomicrobiae bacterium]|nr:hypothetical protein [Verrucomicrobiae bacterium]